MKKALAAFTVIELTIAVVVIGILATISVAGYNSLQQDSRNGQRVSDVQLLTSALEKYFDQKGEYPPCSDLQQSPEVVSTNVLEGLDKAALVAPLAADQSVSSIICRDIESTDGDVYAFIGDTSIDCVNNIACASWTVRYKEEGSNTIKEYKSRNQDALAGPPVTP